MAIKHVVTDSDTHFVVDPITREIVNTSSGKTRLMQYDHNSERFTFEVPRYIENHDMSLCDEIQVHYTNTSVGTSVSLRKTYRGVHTVDDVAIESEEADVITFSWLIPETATMFAGPLKFQLRFICHDNQDERIDGYKWHTEVNDDITVTAGLAYSEEDMDPATTATLQTIKLVEIAGGIDVILDGKHHYIYHGQSGVYVGSGDMPEGYNIQVDVNGENYLTQTIDENSTDDSIPSSKAVYDLFDAYAQQVNTLLEQLVNGEATTE